MTTIALTSIPPRFATLHARLDSLLAHGPDRLCLTIPHAYRRFPDWDGALPALPADVTLLRADDHGPATKFLTVFENYPHDDILIADDDCTYAPGWLSAFEAARRNHPTAVIAASSFDTARLGLPPGHPIVQGFAGVLLRPSHLGPIETDPDGPEIWVDDLWLSALIACAGLPVIPCPAARSRLIPETAPAALQDALIGGRTRADLNRDAAKSLQTHLGVWRAPAT